MPLSLITICLPCSQPSARHTEGGARNTHTAVIAVAQLETYMFARPSLSGAPVWSSGSWLPDHLQMFTGFITSDLELGLIFETVWASLHGQCTATVKVFGHNSWLCNVLTKKDSHGVLVSHDLASTITDLHNPIEMIWDEYLTLERSQSHQQVLSTSGNWLDGSSWRLRKCQWQRFHQSKKVVLLHKSYWFVCLQK